MNEFISAVKGLELGQTVSHRLEINDTPMLVVAVKEPDGYGMVTVNLSTETVKTDLFKHYADVEEWVNYLQFIV